MGSWEGVIAEICLKISAKFLQTLRRITALLTDAKTRSFAISEQSLQNFRKLVRKNPFANDPIIEPLNKA